MRARASVAHRLADAYLTQLKAVLPDSILESRSKLVTLRPNWKDVFDATLCLAVVEGAGSGEIACKQGILGIRWSGALPKQRVASSNLVSRSRPFTAMLEAPRF